MLLVLVVAVLLVVDYYYYYSIAVAVACCISLVGKSIFLAVPAAKQLWLRYYIRTSCVVTILSNDSCGCGFGIGHSNSCGRSKNSSNTSCDAAYCPHSSSYYYDDCYCYSFYLPPPLPHTATRV